MLRTFGKTTAKLRGMAGDFQKQFNEALKEAELDDVKKSVDALRGLNPASQIKKQLNPFEKAAADVRAGARCGDEAETGCCRRQPAEPLKTGAAAVPGETAPAGFDSLLRQRHFPAMEDPAVATPATAPAKTARQQRPSRPPRRKPRRGQAEAAAKPRDRKAAAAKPRQGRLRQKPRPSRPRPQLAKKPAGAAK